MKKRGKPFGRQKRFLLGAILCGLGTLSGCSSTQETLPVVPYSSPSPLSEEEILTEHGLQTSNVGWALYDLKKKRWISTRQSNESFIPASTSKILTALASIQNLGPNHRFQTELRLKGKIRKGVLKGNLFLIGGGDPLLTVSQLMKFVHALEDQGIREVRGQLIYDDPLYPSARALNLEMLPSHYNPGLSSLSTEFNQYQAVLEKGEFAYRYFNLPDFREFDPPRLPEESSRGFRIRHGVTTPDRYTAQVLLTLAQLSGISIQGIQSGRAPQGTRRVLLHRSESVAQLTEKMLEYSNNLIAEMLFMATARKLSRRALAPPQAAQRIEKWIKKAGSRKFDLQSLQIRNGSGLSLQSQITPEQMIALLQLGEKLRFNGTHFSSILPISGWKGTLRNRMLNPDQAFRVWAKTGTLDYVSALAGYLFTQQSKRYAFVIFMMDLEKRRNPPDPEDFPQDTRSGWLKRARQAQDDLLARWILNDGIQKE